MTFLSFRSYSYYIEVSVEQKDWVRVVDYSHCSCRSWQYLYFENRVVQFIRIVGTHNTVNKVSRTHVCRKNDVCVCYRSLNAARHAHVCVVSKGSWKLSWR